MAKLLFLKLFLILILSVYPCLSYMCCSLMACPVFAYSALILIQSVYLKVKELSFYFVNPVGKVVGI